MKQPVLPKEELAKQIQDTCPWLDNFPSKPADRILHILMDGNGDCYRAKRVAEDLIGECREKLKQVEDVANVQVQQIIMEINVVSSACVPLQKGKDLPFKRKVGLLTEMLMMIGSERKAEILLKTLENIDNITVQINDLKSLGNWVMNVKFTDVEV